MGTVWNVTFDLRFEEGTNVKDVVKQFEHDVKGDLPEGCETYRAISFIFKNLDEDLDELALVDPLTPVRYLFMTDAFDGSYSVGYALYNVFNNVFDSMPFKIGSKIIFDSWEDAGGRYVIEKEEKA
jgi:hypothetical protein